LSKYPDYFNSKINGFIAIAPVYSLKYTTVSAIKYLMHFKMDYIIKALGINEFMRSYTNDFTMYYLCKYIGFACNGLMDLISDEDSVHDNDQTTFKTYFGHYPAGTSVKGMIHFGQIYKSGFFSEYDYGSVENLKRYYSIYPPTYKVEDIKMPTCILYGNHDKLSTHKDNLVLKEKLDKNGNIVLFKQYENFGHLTWIIPKTNEHIKDIIDCSEKFNGI